MRVQLSPAGVRKWQRDDNQRLKRKLPPRALAAGKRTFDAVEVGGAVWVKCPNAVEGYAKLEQGEFVEVSE